jgi:hypothetical protein
VCVRVCVSVNSDECGLYLYLAPQTVQSHTHSGSLIHIPPHSHTLSHIHTRTRRVVIHRSMHVPSLMDRGDIFDHRLGGDAVYVCVEYFVVCECVV